MRSFALWSLLALPVALSACTKPETAAAPRSTLPIYSADLLGGAKLCTVPDTVALRDGQLTETTMTVGNDGGWCGLKVSLPGPVPFDNGLVSREARPANGRVHVHAVGDYTRIDYTPDAGFVGSDAFTVELRPGSTRVKVAVQVQAVAQPAVTPAAAPVTPRITAPPPASTTRPTTSRPAASRPATTTPARRAR
jgi:hypothetical protein